MTTQQTTLRISALYHARGMITLSEYREFRCKYLRAVIGGGNLPELPDAWHRVAPGTHITTIEDEPPLAPAITVSGTRNLPPFVVAVALAALVVVIGSWIMFINHS